MATVEKLPGSAEWNLPLMHRIAELLMSYDADAYRAIDVAVSGSVATLKGRVAGEVAYQNALELARTTAGVTEVVDQLRVVRRPRPAATAVSSSTVHAESILFRGAVITVAMIVILGAGGVGAAAAFRYFATSRTAAAPVPPPRPRTVPVEGAVLFEGRPASEARLIFHPLGGREGSVQRAHAVADRDGRFRMTTFAPNDGAVPGMYLVTIDWIPPCPPGGDVEKYADLGNVAPKRFTQTSTTPLRVRVADLAGGVKLPPLSMTRAYDFGTTR